MGGWQLAATGQTQLESSPAAIWTAASLALSSANQVRDNSAHALGAAAKLAVHDFDLNFAQITCKSMEVDHTCN